MKFAISFFVLIFSFSVLALNIEVDVSGMTCSMCVDAITKELQATEKAEKITVKVDEKKARFTELKGKKISDAEIKAAIKKAGYEAVKIRRY